MPVSAFAREIRVITCGPRGDKMQEKKIYKFYWGSPQNTFIFGEKHPPISLRVPEKEIFIKHLILFPGFIS
jgi:hypothetical protein